MSAPPSRPKPLDWGLLALLGLVWGGSFLGVELSLHSLSPLWVAAGRISLAALLLVGVTLLFGAGLPDTRTPTGRRIWLHCLGMGLFTNAIPFSLLSWGQQVVSSSFAGITMAVVPLFVLPLSHLLVPGERLSRARLIGFMIGFAGVVLLIGGDGFGGGASTAVATGTMLPAQIACVAATCCYACGAIITRLCPPVNTIPSPAADCCAAACSSCRWRRWWTASQAMSARQAGAACCFWRFFRQVSRQSS